MDTVTIIGLAAAALTTVSLFPQLLRSYRTRHKKISDISFVLYGGLFCVGIFLWLLYGYYKMDIAMIIANSLSLIQGIFIFIFQYQRYDRK
jgi:MtN3 and saliva related transmembrane protein